MHTYTQFHGPLLSPDLQNAIKADDGTLCRHLLVQRGDPNATNADKQTPIQIAIVNNAWLACKALIDNGAHPTSRDQAKIFEYLESKWVSAINQQLFMLPCPNPYLLEVFHEKRFKPLVPMASSLSLDGMEGIALLLIADESVGPEYGKIVRTYENNPGQLENIQKLAMKQIIMRCRFDHAARICEVIDKITKFFPPHLPLTSLAFEGHGNRTAMEMGPKSFLTCRDIQIMANVSNRLDPKAPILLNGCSSASENSNLARTFSILAPGHVVFGSPGQHCTTSLRCVFTPIPRLVPTYTCYKGYRGFLDEIKAYQDNEEVVNESQPNLNETVFSRIASLMVNLKN
jgi:hypothetical protein